MRGHRRAIRPLNSAAVRAADETIAEHTGGRPLSTGPEDALLRKQWMDAYEEAGGETETVTRNGKKPGATQPCPRQKKNTAGRILSLTFRSDHLDDRGNKLIKNAVMEQVVVHRILAEGEEGPAVAERESYMGDRFTEMRKPEWDAERMRDTDAISHTKDLPVELEIEVEFHVGPEGETATVDSVYGVSRDYDFLTFEKTLGQTVSQERVTITGLVSRGDLPNLVTALGTYIDWFAVIDGEEHDLGTTGLHKIYVTYDKPGGQYGSVRENAFVEGMGPDQVVTESRLEYAVALAEGSGVRDEKECVDQIFREISYTMGVGYVLGRRWEPDPLNNTGVIPKPTLHHYMWLCNAAIGQGECHNIAVSFALACKMVGVQESFEPGFCHPWPSRLEIPPEHPRDPAAVQGKYNDAYRRFHPDPGHAHERLLFLDGDDKSNNFEGVAKYRTGLYAIGDVILDLFSDPHENAASYFAVRGDELDNEGNLTGHIDPEKLDMRTGNTNLVFFSVNAKDQAVVRCGRPYPFETDDRFLWHE